MQHEPLVCDFCVAFSEREVELFFHGRRFPEQLLTNVIGGIVFSDGTFLFVGALA